MPKIMVVEDDQSLREIYSIRLTAEGFELVSAGDGEEALAVAVKEKPDLIISDVMMPKISGFDMLDILRSTPETKNIKVIMMTALSSEDQRKRGENLGADKYLVKSQVGIEDVIAAVREVLGIQPAAGAVPAGETGIAPGNEAGAVGAAETNVAPGSSLPFENNINGGTEMNNLESQPSVGTPENPVPVAEANPAEVAGASAPAAGVVAGVGAAALNQVTGAAQNVVSEAQNAVAGAQAAVAGAQEAVQQAVNTVQNQVATAQEAVAGVQNTVANAGAAVSNMAQNLQGMVGGATPAATVEPAANPVATAPVETPTPTPVAEAVTAGAEATPGLVVGTNEVAGAGAEVTTESVMAAAPAGMEGNSEVMSSASVVVPDGVSSPEGAGAGSAEATVSPASETAGAGVDTSGLAEMQDMLAHTSVEELDPNAAADEAGAVAGADASAEAEAVAGTGEAAA